MAVESGKGKLAWVTGIGGFIGDAVAARLTAEGWRVAGFGHQAGTARLPHGAWTLSRTINQADVVAAVQAHGPPALVVHAAGGSHVGRADAEPGEDFRRTVQTTGELVHGLGLAGCCDGTHLIYPSSAAIYGHQPEGPISDDTPPAPISQYGWHKLMAETVCRQGAQRYGLRVSLVRFFSLYGPGLRKQLFWELGSRLLAGCDRLELAGTGTETRDFLDIGDAVALMLRLHATPLSPVRIVNGGSGRATSVSDAIALLQRALSTQVPVIFTGLVRRHDPRHLCAGLTAGEQVAVTDLAQGLAAYAAWLRSTQDAEREKDMPQWRQ